MNKGNLIILLCIILFSCGDKWPSDRQENYLNDCLLTASALDVTNTQDYCQCMLERSMKRFPTEKDFVNAQINKDQSIMIDLDSCLYKSQSFNMYWPESIKQTIKEDCFELAKYNKMNNPEGYCNCMIENLMSNHPSINSIDSITTSDILTAGENCE